MRVVKKTIADVSHDDLLQILQHGQCHCGEPGVEEHICPFSQDVHGDSETTCNCCGSCEYNCAMDI